jgi:tripartite-type tricarboxylate transporter receptor subunit TctC
MRLRILLVALIAWAGTAAAQADTYPSKPIRVIVPYAAGSTGEAALRLIAAEIDPRLGQRFVIESRPGAAGNIGAQAVVGAEPDGYTLLLGATNNFAINQFLYDSMGFDPLTAFQPVATLVDLPFMMYASGQLPAATIAEIVALAKTKAGGLSYASSGVGSPPHLGGALFGQVAGIPVTHVPYRSNAQSLTALLANDVQLYFGLIGGAQEHADAGRLRIVAAAGPTRSSNFPNVPSAAEAGYPNFRISNWWALVAPRNTPAAVTERIAGEVKTALANPALRDRLTQMGMVPLGEGPTELAARMRGDAAVWRDVITAAGITLK